MEPNAGNYNPGHYAVQNREELGRALSKGTLDLSAKQFGELDAYDKEKWNKHPSIDVPKPKHMKKTTGRKKMPEEQREYCDYLNTLIHPLACTYYVLR